ncbi:extracellular solute-binding protein [Marinimicrococcus flavescens]|uniref:Extracellular solute-binding protein n=1 Tax=Marinimicrococcus flavescens TaxID=3031815 RepID=A0AAP3XSB1_9PROT|nr:extracellular solute-binding protein [Marinimicrococcus flavescens]
MLARRTSMLLLGAAIVLGAAPAMAEGRVSVYTAHKAEIVERLIPEFEKATGMKADVVKAGSGDIINRVKAESANPQADVIWSIGAELLEANSDLLEKYEPAELDKVDPAFMGKDAAWIPYTGILTVLMVNTGKLKPEEYPKTWKDLGDERFKGQISSARADKSGSAFIQLGTVLSIYGDDEQGWEVYKQAFDNFALSNSSGAVPRFVNDGEATVGITLEDNAYLYVKGGGPVAIVYPEDGTSALADGMALVKGAPNPEGGKAFLDWALSRETQELVVAELGRRPIRKDMEAAADLKPMSEIKLVDYDIVWAANHRDEFLEKWNELLLSR